MNKVRRSGGRWVADFICPETGKRRRIKADTQEQAQERMAYELAAIGDSQPRTAAFTMKEAMALTHQMRWAGKASETNAMGYCSQVVDFYGPAYPIAKVDAQNFMRMRQFFLQKGNSNGTVNWKHSCLSSMLKCSELMGHIKASPRLPDSCLSKARGIVSSHHGNRRHSLLTSKRSANQKQRTCSRF